MRQTRYTTTLGAVFSVLALTSAAEARQTEATGSSERQAMSKAKAQAGWACTSLGRPVGIEYESSLIGFSHKAVATFTCSDDSRTLNQSKRSRSSNTEYKRFGDSDRSLRKAYREAEEKARKLCMNGGGVPFYTERLNRGEKAYKYRVKVVFYCRY